MILAFNTEEELKRAIEDYRRLKEKNLGTTPTDKSSEAIAGDPATVKAA